MKIGQQGYIAAGRQVYSSIDDSKHRNDLEGLRAVAVIPVILFHLDLNVFPGGFVGVDVFFVLSGYLITGIIAHELGAERFSIWNFFDRRIRRIMPALVLVTAFSLFVSYEFLLPLRFIEFAESIFATSLSLSNIYFWMNSGYFAANAEMMPLLHTWSLAIEEQFYFFFPISLLLFWRLRRRLLIALVWLAFSTSFAISVWGAANSPDGAFYLLPSRAWELLMGSLIALKAIPTPSASWQRQGASGLGIVAILAPALLYTDNTPFPGYFAAIPCMGAGPRHLVWS